QDRQAGVLERRELPREGAELLAGDAADGEGLALLLPAALPLLAALAFGLAELGQLRDEVTHLLDLLLRFFFVQGLDLVLDLFPGRVHRLEFEGRHGSPSSSVFAARGFAGCPAKPQAAGGLTYRFPKRSRARPPRSWSGRCT